MNICVEKSNSLLLHVNLSFILYWYKDKIKLFPIVNNSKYS